jgi:hypothetical protein
MPFTLGEIAVQGLPEGTYVVRVDDVEASMNSNKDGETIVFKETVAQSENPKVKVGAKHLHSYTYKPEWRSIVANDLVRAGLPKETQLSGDAKADALVIAGAMRSNFYEIQIKAQTRDKTRTNTSIVRPYAGAQPNAGPATAAAPVAAVAAASALAAVPPPAPVGAPTVAVVAPAAAPAVAPVAFAPPAAVPPVVPAAVAPAPAVAPPAPTEPTLDAPLIQAVTLASQGQGTYPPLNVTQIRQLREIGMDAVAAAYEAALPPPAAAAPLLAPPTAATAFMAV